MTQLANTKFFLLIKGNEENTSVLQQEYENFAACMFSESKTATDRDEYHNLLAYTYVELSCLEAETKKKCFCLS